MISYNEELRLTGSLLSNSVETWIKHEFIPIDFRWVEVNVDTVGELSFQLKLNLRPPLTENSPADTHSGFNVHLESVHVKLTRVALRGSELGRCITADSAVLLGGIRRSWFDWPWLMMDSQTPAENVFLLHTDHFLRSATGAFFTSKNGTSAPPSYLD